jgi:DNA anti-recombination protein RmuC
MQLCANNWAYEMNIQMSKETINLTRALKGTVNARKLGELVLEEY